MYLTNVSIFVMGTNQRLGVKRPVNINLATLTECPSNYRKCAKPNQHPGNHPQHSDATAMISTWAKNTFSLKDKVGELAAETFLVYLSE